MASPPSRNDCYHVIEELGKGTFGKVLKAQRIETGELVAIKIMKNNVTRSRVITNELKILHVIRQVDPDASHLVRFYEHFQVLDHFCLVFELLQQNLYEYQREIGFDPIPLRHIRTITAQVLEALSKLKELSIIHSDLKPENIVLVDHLQYPFRVKVIDFGSASILSEVKHVREPYIQSRFYRAPEILLGLPFSEKLDMWSLGCIIAELHFGSPLYPGNNEYDQIRYICDTLGMPDSYLLNAARKALWFFKYKVDAQRQIQWSMKAEGEHQNVKTIERRKYVLRSLEQIELMYRTRTCYPQSEVLAEHSDLKNMVELMKMMLTWDSNKRISPDTALKHPFISLQHMKTHYRSTRYYLLSQQNRYGTTQPEPPGCCRGLCSPSYYQDQIMNDITDGEEVERWIEEMTGLLVEDYAEGGLYNMTGQASYHQKTRDAPHDASGHINPLLPESGDEIGAALLDNHHDLKADRPPQSSRFSRLSPSKSNAEETTNRKPEAETQQQRTAPPMDRVCHSMEGEKTGTENCPERLWFCVSHNAPPYRPYRQVNHMTS